jgi:hypothetical protein
VVFTLPRHLAPLVLQNKKVLHDLLFPTSAETLLEVARNPKRLGAEIGFFIVLHRWSQKLETHPHVHSSFPPVDGRPITPKGFVRIRHCGFLANRKRATNLPLSFQLLDCRRCGVIA